LVALLEEFSSLVIQPTETDLISSKP
jgi:hypothetical protein